MTNYSINSNTKQKMKTLIIDDELLARRRILNLLKEIPEIEVLGEVSTGRAAIKQINELKPALIFLISI